MLITTVCPGCQTRIHLDSVLRGQTIRCPSNNCRQPFVVGEAPPPPPPPPRTGAVGDFIPLLSAEAVVPADDKPELGSKHVADMVPLAEAEMVVPLDDPVEASWEQPPPVRGPAARPAVPPAKPRPAKKPAARNGHPAPVQEAAPAVAPVEESPPELVEPVAEAPPTVAPPVELPAGHWAEPPPVRRGAAVTEETAPSSGEDHATAVVARRKSRNKLVIVLLLIGTAVLLGGGGFVGFLFIRQSESNLRARAIKELEEGKYSQAAISFRELDEKFGATSEEAEKYRFLQQLAETLAALTAGNDPAAALDKVGEFVDAHKAGPFLKQHGKQLADETLKLVDRLIAANKDSPSDSTPAYMDKAAFNLDKIAALGKDVVSQSELERKMAAINDVRSAHAKWARRRDARDRILALLGAKDIHPADAIKAGKRFVRFEEREHPGIGMDPEIAKGFTDLYQRHLDSVVFIEGGASAERPAAADDAPPSILVDTLIAGSPGKAPDADPVVLSLARGVLYAQSRATGAVRWAMRVGVDTTNLPIRVPATPANPERILVLSADTEMLTALDADGTEVWRYRLSSPCLGRPVVVEPLVYLPTYDGQVHEVELAGGRSLGRYQLGQHLSIGGARAGKSKVIFFPADDFCVYALDVGQRKCQAILYSDHPAGSLRGEPLVVAPGQKAIAGNMAALPGFLILNQADGLNATLLRVFALPFTDREGPPIALNPAPRLPGWTWFTPFHDGEKIVAATDDGAFGLFGIQQARNRDPALFPMLQVLNLDDAGLKQDGPTRGRAQIVHAQGDDFWVLSRGKMQRMELVWNAAVGPRLAPSWREPLELGSPLHVSQVEEDRVSGQNTLIVVTRALKQEICLATAIRDETGERIWQRQLGFVAQGEPLLLRGPAKAAAAAASAVPFAAGLAATTLPPPEPPPVVLGLDQGGGVFAFDPLPFSRGQSQWLTGAQAVAGALDDNPAFAPLLVPGLDAASAYEIAAPGAGAELIVRHFRLEPTTRQVKLEKTQAVPLPAQPAGPPALVGNALILPLNDGVLYRLTLDPLAPRVTGGANWRSERIGAEARGYVAALTADTFLATDGGKGLTVWKIGENGVMSAFLPKGKDEVPTLELDDRVWNAPLVLAHVREQPHVLVADPSGVLRLLKLTPTSTLEETKRRRDLGGRLTAGPYLLTPPSGVPRIGCIVEGKRFVLLDAEKLTVLWEYRTTGSVIVGEPQLVHGRLIVADLSGRIVALDPATGTQEGPGYSLAGSMAPAASPVAFDGNQLFAPLSDGTVMLLPIGSFR